MRKQYAITQVCEITLTKYEVEEIVVASMLARGADPSYDFAEDHPICIWDGKGNLAVRFVQAAVTAREVERFVSLRPMPTKDEVRKVMDERRQKAEAAMVKAPA